MDSCRVPMLRILKRQPKTIYGKVQPSSLLRAPIYHSCRNDGLIGLSTLRSFGSNHSRCVELTIWALSQGATHLQRDLPIQDILFPVIYRLPTCDYFQEPSLLWHSHPCARKCLKLRQIMEVRNQRLAMLIPPWHKRTRQHGYLEPQVASSPLRAW